MLKTALNMIEEVSNPYLISNPLKTVRKSQNFPTYVQISEKINRNKKFGLHYDIRDIPISLHAKFQGNRTIRLGEKR